MKMKIKLVRELKKHLMMDYAKEKIYLLLEKYGQNIKMTQKKQ